MIDAMKQALEALKRLNDIDGMYSWVDTEQALRQAIEQAEKQEPVAWMYKNGIYMSDPSNSVSPEFVITPLYTAPPKREWIGLTDEEIAQTVGSPIDEVYLADFHRVIEKLRSKNT
jgi:hypothetical protein